MNYQDRLDRMYEAEDRSLAMDKIELANAARDLLDRNGERSLRVMQLGLSAIYESLSISDHERRELRRDWAD